MINTRHGIAIALVAFTFLPRMNHALDLIPLEIKLPTESMIEKTREMKIILGRASATDRKLWTACFSRIAQIIEADTIEPFVIGSSLECSAFHRAALTFVWKGIGGNRHNKYPGLSDAAESLFSDLIGNDVRSFQEADKKKVAELYRAFAYCGQ